MTVVHVLFLLIFQSVTEISKCYVPCLTWVFDGNNIHFTCRVQNLVSTVGFIDPSGIPQATCLFADTVPQCASYHKNGHITWKNTLRKEIRFTISEVQEDFVNGIWTCMHGETKYHTNVSSEKGIISATDVHLIGSFNQSSNETIKLVCFSCREPHGHNVEFMVNHKTEDSIAYNSGTNKCTHKDGECHPYMCSCLPSGNEFTLHIPVAMHSYDIYFSCEMNFVDHIKASIFSKIATILFNGTEFVGKAERTIMKKLPVQKINNEDKTDNTPIAGPIVDVTDSIRKFPDDGEDGKADSGVKLFGLVMTLVLAVAVALTIIVCVYRYGQSKKEKPPTTDRIMTYRELGMENQPLSDRCSNIETPEDSEIEEEDTLPLTSESKIIFKDEDIQTKEEDTVHITIGSRISSTENNETQLEDASNSNTDLNISSSGWMQTIPQHWIDSENTVVETNVLKQLQNIIKTEDVVTVIGSFGCGKSFTLQHIALQLKNCQEYEIIVSNCPEYIKKHYNSQIKQVFVFDDIIGKYSIDNQKVQSWQANYLVVKEMVQSNQTKIISSCRKNLFHESNLDQIPLISDIVFDLSSSEYTLTTTERESIARIYLSEKQLQALEQRDLISKFDFFPLLCSNFSKKNSMEIAEFFNEYVFTEHLTYLMNASDNRTFATLLLFVIYDNSFSANLMMNTSAFSNVLNKISGSPSIKSELTIDTVIDVINELLGSYVEISKGKYNILHEKVFNILVSFYGKNMLDVVLELSDSKIIRDCCQFTSLDSNTQDILISVPQSKETAYFNRLAKDLNDGFLINIFWNRQLQWPLFRAKLIGFIEETDHIHHLLQFSKVKYSPLFAMAANGYSDVVKVLLDEGFKVNVEDDNGRTPLCHAIRKGHADTVQILLDYGSSPSINIKNQNKPLHIAAKYGYERIVQLLLDNNAAINVVNHLHRTPIWIASSEGYSSIVKCLLKNNADPDICDDKKETPLIQASTNGWTDIVELLLQYCADPDSENEDNETCLWKASRNGYTDIVKLLIKYNANINATAKNDETAIWAASSKGCIDIVKLLLENEADYSITNEKKDTPLAIAARNGYTAIVELLFYFGSPVPLPMARPYSY